MQFLTQILDPGINGRRHGLRAIPGLNQQPLVKEADSLELVHQAVPAHDPVVEVRERPDRLDTLLIHDQREPEPEFGDIYRRRIDIYTVERILYRLPFQLVYRPIRALPGKEWRQDRAGLHDLVHHPHRERARTHRRVHHPDRAEQTVKFGVMVPDGLRQGKPGIPEPPLILAAGLLRMDGHPDGDIAAPDEPFQVIAGNTRVVRKIADQTLLAHIMHNITRSVERPLRFPVGHIEEVLKDLPEHLRVDRHLPLQGLVLFDGEVKLVKCLQNIPKDLVFYPQIRADPVIVLDRLEETAIQERDLAPEPAVVVLVYGAVFSKRLIEERFENIVEETLVRYNLPVIQAAHEILRPRAPLLEPPGRGVLPHPEPPLLLEEIEEDDLAEEFLREIDRRDLLLLELSFADRIGIERPLKRLLQVEVTGLVLLEELLCDILDAETVLDIRKNRGSILLPDKAEESFPAGMVRLVLPHKIRKPACRRQFQARADPSVVAGLKLILEPDEREAPVIVVVAVKRDQSRIPPFVVEELCDEVPLHRSGAVA